jgi:hypothetical protein
MNQHIPHPTEDGQNRMQDALSRMKLSSNTKAKISILEAVHETATDLYSLGFIETQKMKKLDVLCLESVPSCSAADIKAIQT